MEIWRIVKAIRQTGIATVIVDKNHAAVTSICDRAMILVKGEVVFNGTSDEVRASPDLIQKHLGVGH
jgi:branched-chain amino acid transport system ATP-binding protein